MSLFLRTLDPFKELHDIEKRFTHYYPAENQDNAGFTPSVNTREGDYAYHIEVDLPGVKKEDIHIEVKNHQLVISGERKTKQEVKEEDYYRVESRYGRFERAFTLSDQIDSENIAASCEDGVLEVVLPKLIEKDEGKKIEVQ